MRKYAAIKMAEVIETDKTYTVTQEMVDNAPHFDTEEEAGKYADLINPDFLWVIIPTQN